MDKRKVLIVEDSDFSRTALRDGFKDEYEIIEAADGEMALAILKVNKVDIVLLDIVLPKLDGISVLKKIREDRNFSGTTIGQHPFYLPSKKEQIERDRDPSVIRFSPTKYNMNIKNEPDDTPSRRFLKRWSNFESKEDEEKKD